jgi:cysteine-rich repeat protein
MTRLFPSIRPFVFLLMATAALGIAAAPTAALAVCGDTVPDTGEDCDDGNTLDGDCCSAACLFESVGSACADDGEFCTRDQCDGAGVCLHDGTPLDTCLVAPKGKLQIADDANDAKDKLNLQMQNAPGISPTDFGDPTTSDTYHACIFGPDGLLMQAEVGPGGVCDGKPCWAQTTTGFTYKDNGGGSDGITALSLKASAKPKTKLSAKGRGAALEDAALPFPSAVMAQIVNGQTGRCFETYFLEPSAVKKNTSELYDAKAAAPGFEIPGLAKVIRQENPVGGNLSADPAETDPRVIPNIGPDPTQVYVQSLTYGGSGCPQDSVGQSIGNDLGSLTLIFDQYVAAKGPGIPLPNAQKSCQINLNLKIPQGWQYSIATLDYRGYVSLPKKMKATQEATYYFQGDGELASADTSFAGPVNRDYLIRDTLPFSTVVWSSCNQARPLNITTQLEVKGGSELGQITTDSVDGKVKFVLGLHWKPCE